MVSTFQNAWFPKKPKKKLQAVGDTLTGGISHQFGTPGVTSGVDTVPPACSAVPAVSVGLATRRRVRRQKRRHATLTVDGVDVKATTAVTYAEIFVGDISRTVTNVQLQKVFNTNALVGRYYKKGIAKVLVPLDQLDQALSQDTSSISHGRKFRVAKWVTKAPSPRVHGHQAVRGRKILSAAYTASEDSLMKDRARFVAEFLTAAQNPGDGLQKSSPRGQRLYSQVHIAAEKTTEMRIKSMEIAMRDMMRLLRCIK